MSDRQPGGIDFLNGFSSKNSVRMYKGTIKDYLTFIYGKVENGDLERRAKQYFSEGRDYEKDVDMFFQNRKDLASKTRKFKLSVVRVFLMENGVELPGAFWRRLRDRVKGSRA